MTAHSDTVDDLDRAIIHALTVDARVPLSRVAAVIGVSDQTVARRYRRLRSSGAMRVVGLLDARPSGHVDWALRLRVAPGSAAAVARALALRDDTGWIQVAAGGTEVVFGTHAGDRAEFDALLERLAETQQIRGFESQCVLHTFRGGPAPWLGLVGALSDEQVDALRPARAEARETDAAPAPEDASLVAELGVDGRIPLAELARRLSSSESAIRRRIEILRGTGALFFDVEVDERRLGIASTALLWMTVVPAELEAIGTALAEHREIGFVGATSGATNVLASVQTTDVYGLYDYLSFSVGRLEGIVSVETVPIARTVKRSPTSRDRRVAR